MATLEQVSDYIILRLKSEGTMSLNFLKLQKLVYYSQAWYLAFYNQKLFEGDFQAWIHGPVSRELFDLYKGQKLLYSEIQLSDVTNQANANNLTLKEKKHIDIVLDTYAQYSASQLEELTHGEEPWKNARKGVMSFERCDNVIDADAIKTYFKARMKG